MTPVVITADDAGLDLAAERLRAGELVAFPTETVYGLGADATDDKAVAAIFAAKGRPHFNPLIVHVPDLAAARRLGRFTPLAEKLAAAFWPGALSIVVPRAEDCPLSLLVSAGLDSVAIRVPAHPLAHEVLVRTGRPVAAPSANPSGAVSATTAGHVAHSFADLPGDLRMTILDGGACAVGLESAVVDACGKTATLLRAGGIADEDIEAVTGNLLVADNDDTAPKSPGMLSRHYAPTTPLRLGADGARPGEALLGFGAAPEGTRWNLSPTGDLREAAANLFAMLRALDAEGHAGIAVMAVPERGLGRAMNDRLRRAATPAE
ncbi:MAG: L-threonylcarbamoyladenylate synthase [Rhodospirillaceae bacterium]